ncbi:hypothetical protein M011DRAFT_467416 [Sporormia fimetaria CBS 119925]|uniref:Uncharacterized protein n=1 Tax=Sporormia fimetaria CBS 119925 TaxID=1340428 RepID=A0A6A6VDM6_9PLEO|nr:hypothetical protein M011DRAFT_467416 [Sporormia fimetaria CBS 119925]
MSISWLKQKRKGELIDIAHEVDLPEPNLDRLLKNDLVDKLQEHLETHRSTYSKRPAFDDFYTRGSPIKRERLSPVPVVSVSRPRRSTINRLEQDEPTPEKSLVTRTPALVARRVSTTTRAPATGSVTRTPATSSASRTSGVLSQIPSPQVDIPASPSQLAEVADQSFQAAKGKVSELWERTHLEETIGDIRENASSVVFIQMAILLVESFGLLWNTGNTFAAQTPSVAALNLPSKTIALPDMSYLLKSEFWASATLWSVTSWALPLLFSYFFNLTLKSNTRHKSTNKQYTVDPLTFNIARALLAYSAYSLPVADAALVGEPGIVDARKPGWGPFAELTVNTVRQHIPGRYYGMQIGSVIGVLFSLYDAALKK